LTWQDGDEVVTAKLRAELSAERPELLPWLALIAIALDAEVPPTREVEDLAAEFRSAKLHDVVIEFLRPALAVPTLVQIEHAHLMDEASASLLEALSHQLAESRWVVLVTRRDVEYGFSAGPGRAHRLELGPLTPEEALLLAEASPEANSVPPHLLEQAV